MNLIKCVIIFLFRILTLERTVEVLNLYPDSKNIVSIESYTANYIPRIFKNP